MCALKASVPTVVIKIKEIIESTMYQMTLETSHSPFVRGVRESCLKNLDFLYSEEMFTMENMGLVKMEKPIKPGNQEIDVTVGFRYYVLRRDSDDWVSR